MRLLIDESLSTQIALALRADGHDAVHVGDRGLLGASDEAVLGRARREDRVLISADTDFGRLLAVRGAIGPSVVLLRGQSHRPVDQARLLGDALPQVQEQLEEGAIVVVTGRLVRIRTLPIVTSPRDRPTDEG